MNSQMQPADLCRVCPDLRVNLVRYWVKTLLVWKSVVSGPTRLSDPGICPTWQTTVTFCLELAGYFYICLTETPPICF